MFDSGLRAVGQTEGATQAPIYNLEGAAERCGVKREQVLDWIDLGLRAFPLGSAMQYRARDYIILEEWLVDFFRAHGTVSKHAEKNKVVARRKDRRPVGVTRDKPIGPCPV
jgi:hypothetical protein